MAYTGTLLTINGTPLPGLKKYRVSYSKFWRNAERNMSGDVRATFVGVFPKLELEFGGVLDENRVSQIVNLLNNAYFSVTYFDPKSKATRTAQYYAGDYAVELMDKQRGLYQPFTVNLVPVSRTS